MMPRKCCQPLTVLSLAFATAVLALCGQKADATIVRFVTTLGNIDVRMYDSATPLSVANFMNYVNDGDFDGTIFHRAPKQFRRDEQGEIVVDDQGDPIIDTFVVQGGGFTFTDEAGAVPIPTDPPVLNEPGISNEVLTIAYAKLDGDPDSATSGFFFNTVDNSENLDNQNGGFTVFGRIIRGSSALTAISDLDVLGSSSTPVFDTSQGFLESNLVFVETVVELGLPDGDYNLDGVVDLADFATWQSDFGSTFRVRSDGNGNGIVDASDYAVWREAFLASGGSLAGLGVPEPAGAILVGVAFSWASIRRRR